MNYTSRAAPAAWIAQRAAGAGTPSARVSRMTQIGRLCLAFVISFALQGSPSFADETECPVNLSALEQSRPGTLRNAVLIIDGRGKRRLVTGSYFYGSHRELVWRAHLDSGVNEVLFLGELRLEILNGVPQIYDANDTAGHSIVLKNGRTKNSGGSYPLPFEERFPFLKNDIDKLPVPFLTSSFWPQRFGSGTALHLSEVLNQASPEVENNFRHRARTGVQAITGLVIFAVMQPDDTLARKIVRDLRDKSQLNLSTAENVLKYLLGRGEIESAKVQVVLRALAAIESLDVQTMRALDYARLEAEVDHLLELDYRSYVAP